MRGSGSHTRTTLPGRATHLRPPHRPCPRRTRGPASRRPRRAVRVRRLTPPLCPGRRRRAGPRGGLPPALGPPAPGCWVLRPPGGSSSSRAGAPAAGARWLGLLSGCCGFSASRWGSRLALQSRGRCGVARGQPACTELDPRRRRSWSRPSRASDRNPQLSFTRLVPVPQ